MTAHSSPGDVLAVGVEACEAVADFPPATARTADLEFEVLGLPAPQGSKRAISIGGHARLVDGSSDTGKARTKAWRADVAQAARDLLTHTDPDIRATQFDGPTEIVIEFWFPRPKSRPKRHHGWHTTKPDKDKVLRATFDGLVQGGLLRDDSIIARFTVDAIETTGATGALITIRPLPPREALR